MHAPNTSSWEEGMLPTSCPRTRNSMLRPTYLAHQFSELASAIQAEFEAAQANLEFVANMWPRVPS